MAIFLVGVGLLVIAIAMVYIFAILGRLAALLPDPEETSVDSSPTRVPLSPSRSNLALPEGFRGLSDRLDLILALSPTCVACREIVANAPGLHDALNGSNAGLVVIASSIDEAEAFLAGADRDLAKFYPIAYDVGGVWSSSVGVHLTPALITVRDGTLSEVYAVSSTDAIHEALVEQAS